MRILPATGRVTRKWKNGLGVTEVVASDSDGDEFTWRISIATITADGRFSDYAGVDRLLMLLSTGGLTLSLGAVERRVEQYEVIGFAGELDAAAVQVTSPGRDLNLMTRRGAAEGAIANVRFTECTVVEVSPEEIVVCVNLLGALTVGPHRLEHADAAVLEAGESVAFHGLGRIAIARIRRF